MASIGSLVADLRLESAAFHRDMGKAATAVSSDTAKMRRSMQQVQAAAGNVQRQFGQLRSAALALGAALAVRQFAQMTQGALDAADAIAKTADAVGLSTSALQEYRVAAGLSGVSSEKFGGALEKLTRSIGDARNGTGALVTALKDSDKALLDQITRAGSTEQALDLLFTKLANTANEFDRNALAAAAFGRSGVALVNMVSDGTAGLEAMRQAAVDMGLVLEESLIRKAEEVNDRMELLKGAFATGFQRSIIEGFAESFQLTKENIEAARVAGEHFGQFVGASMRVVASAAQGIAPYLREIVAGLASIIALKAASMFVGVASAVVTFGVALVKAARAGVLLDLIMSKSVVGVLSKIAVTVAVAAGTWEIFGREAVKALNATEDSLLSFGEGMDVLAGGAEDKIGDVIATLQRQRDETKRLADAQRQGERAVELVTAAIQIENAQRQAGVTFTQEQTDKMLRLTLQTNKYRREIQAVIDAEESARRAAEDAMAERARLAEEQSREMARMAEENARAVEQPFLNMIDGIQAAFVEPYGELDDDTLADPAFRAETAASIEGVFSCL